MIDDLLLLLWRSTIASSVAALGVFAIRPMLRRVFGSGVAYGAWVAVPLCTVAALVPPPVDPAWTLSVVPPSLSVARVVSMPTAAAPPVWPVLILMAWAVGVIVMAAWQIRLQRNFMRDLGPLAVTGDIAVSTSLAAGPSLVGLWRPLIAVPADFEQRYTSRERALIVAHERAHARHRDTVVNAVCAAGRCLWWFNPVIHVAARVVRVDQELTRDAEVMRAYPGSQRAYARAMLKAQLVASDSPITCHWQSKHPLEERIMNLARTTPVVIRRLGAVVVSFAMFGGTYAAWAAQGASDVDPGRVDHARWTDARPATVVTVEAGPKPAQFLVSAVIKDLVTGAVLAKPRLLTKAGVPATMEMGTEKVGVRLVVTVNPSGRDAEYTNEVLRDGHVESSQSGTLALALADRSEPAALQATANDAVPETGPFFFNLSFSSSDANELACAADVFAARGDTGLAGAMRVPADGKIHTVSFSTTTPTIDKGANALVTALSKCQLGVDSNLAYSMKPGSIVQP